MIFINYRRADTSAYPLFVHAKLEEVYRRQVFIDVEGRLTGRGSFDKALMEFIGRSKIVICFIGQDWLLRGETDKPRLFEPDDLVRRELDFAILTQKPILPVLVNGAHMPRPSDIPSSLVEVTKANAQHLRHETAYDDAKTLIQAVRRVLSAPVLTQSRASPPLSLSAPLSGFENLMERASTQEPYNALVGWPQPNAMLQGEPTNLNALVGLGIMPAATRLPNRSRS